MQVKLNLGGQYMKLITRWLVSAISIYIIAYFIQGISIDGPGAALTAAAVLGIVNTFIRPIIKFFALPITIATLGIFSLVINGAFLMLTANLVEGFSVYSFSAAFVGSILFSIVSMVIGNITGANKK